MKKYVISIILIPLSFSTLFITLDLLNITNFIPLTNKYDWLNFFGSFLGSMIGGIITFFGVYYTIKYQRKSDDEKNRLSIIPILEYKVSYDKNDFDNSKGQLAGKTVSHINIEGAVYNNPDSEEWYFNLITKNVGVGHAQIIEVELIFKENGTDNVVHSSKEGYCYKLLKKDDIEHLMFMIYAKKEHFYKDGEPSQGFIYPLDIIIIYQDLIGNRYSQVVHSCIYKAVLYVNDKVNSHWNVQGNCYYENFEYLENKKEDMYVKRG